LKYFTLSVSFVGYSLVFLFKKKLIAEYPTILVSLVVLSNVSNEINAIIVGLKCGALNSYNNYKLLMKFVI